MPEDFIILHIFKINLRKILYNIKNNEGRKICNICGLSIMAINTFMRKEIKFRLSMYQFNSLIEMLEAYMMNIVKTVMNTAFIIYIMTRPTAHL